MKWAAKRTQLTISSCLPLTYINMEDLSPTPPTLQKIKPDTLVTSPDILSNDVFRS